MRLLVAKIEIVLGFSLVILCAAHLSWCAWSLPRHGIQGPHGIDTGVCNWGTELSRIVVAAIAVLTIFSGAIGFRVRSRSLPWYAAQTPAIVAWGWLICGLIYTLLIYEG
jgi:hypothetical protein